MSEIFLTHWQIAGHFSDIAGPGDWLTFDLLTERAVVMRGHDGELRAFHNLCRHRGARLLEGDGGNCRGALVCPFHGWVYNVDGTLRGPARPETFGDIDPSKFSLKPVEMEVWRGFVFLRFATGPQPSVAEMMQPFDTEIAHYRTEELLPVSTTAASWETKIEVNWKSVRDVDNEGYHVAMAHPALQELYGRSYVDSFYAAGLSRSHAVFGDRPGQLWSVRHDVKHAPEQDWLPPSLRKA